MPQWGWPYNGLIASRDPVALADKVTRLLTNEGLRRRIGQRAACWAEAYGWPTIADRIEAVYEQVISAPQSPATTPGEGL